MFTLRAEIPIHTQDGEGTGVMELFMGNLNSGIS